MCRKLFFLTSFILMLGLTNGTAQAELRASLEVEPARLIDLTAEGTADWAYWRYDSVTKANQKAGATDIGELTLIGNVGVGDSWATHFDVVFTDGENPVSGRVDDVGNRVWILYQGQYALPPTVDEGYELVVAAGIVNRTLKLYIQNKWTYGKIVATLGDESLETIVDTGETGHIDYGYTLDFSHPTAHELHVRYFYPPDAPYYDSVRMGAATLSGPLVQIQTKATEPRPEDGQQDVPRDVVLGWTPGVYAATTNGHKVYFSENFNDVKDGIGGITQDASSYAPGQRLDFNTTYYWRVDEASGPPDHTVFEGRVWSFTTELFTYAIENITATASSAHKADTGPENTINGSGLDDNDLHSNEETDMWLSSTEPLGAWIEYQFDKIYKLHQMWVWNSNQTVERLLGFGLKDVTIDYSTNGTDYKTLGTTAEFARAPGAPGYAHNTTVDLSGVAAKYVRLTANSNWGGIMPQYGLSEVRFFHIPVHARNPHPDSGATDVDVDVVLDWAAGREGVTHDVHFGDGKQAVIDSTTPVATVAETGYGPLSLNLGQTYYWRVDEVNEAETPATWQGDLWDFTTQEYFVVDDFESYNDLDTTDLASKRIFNVWVDGYQIPTNGSLVGYENSPFCERTIIHGGKQSMPFFYNNTGGAAYSEAGLPLSPPQNWTQAGIATLVLYFYGPEGNTGQLYVKVDGSKVVYPGDAADIAKPQWKQWNIDLASLGVNLQSIAKLSIGIDGNGATGTLYLDDIRLYRSATELRNTMN